MNDVTERPNSCLGGDHLSSCDCRQVLVGRILPTPVVPAALVRYPFCNRLVNDRRIRCPKNFSHPRNASGGNDCEAGSRYGPTLHGRSLLLHAQSALPRWHDTCTGDWTGLRDRVVLLLAFLAAFAVQKLAIERRKGISRHDWGRPM
jgi:hypothetical protein